MTDVTIEEEVQPPDDDGYTSHIRKLVLKATASEIEAEVERADPWLRHSFVQYGRQIAKELHSRIRMPYTVCLDMAMQSTYLLKAKIYKKDHRVWLYKGTRRRESVETVPNPAPATPRSNENNNSGYDVTSASLVSGSGMDIVDVQCCRAKANSVEATPPFSQGLNSSSGASSSVDPKYEKYITCHCNSLSDIFHDNSYPLLQAGIGLDRRCASESEIQTSSSYGGRFRGRKRVSDQSLEESSGCGSQERNPSSAFGCSEGSVSIGRREGSANHAVMFPPLQKPRICSPCGLVLTYVQVNIDVIHMYDVEHMDPS